MLLVVKGICNVREYRVFILSVFLEFSYVRELGFLEIMNDCIL